MLLAAIASATAASRPGVIAHRGAALRAPENTLAAIEEAIRLGCAMAEVDVRYTADAQVILMHDSTLDRSTNGTGPVEEMTLAEIARLTVRGSGPAQVRVPTLREAITTARGRIQLYLDLKVDDPLPAARLVGEMQAESFVFFRSVTISGLDRIRSIDPRFRLLLDVHYLPAEAGYIPVLHGRFPTAALSNSLENWTEALLREARAKGIATIVNLLEKEDTPENWRRAAVAGFDYLMTDYPAEALEVIREAPAAETGGRSPAGVE
ncbi:MAG: glycerophosphodiester phosphodiesterase family protein [Acidobacteria bacterium]|nr:glycerophosphodiester phosphodiesterase family protein [Acidobacteriota bacterium]